MSQIIVQTENVSARFKGEEGNLRKSCPKISCTVKSAKSLTVEVIPTHQPLQSKKSPRRALSRQFRNYEGKSQVPGSRNSQNTCPQPSVRANP
jgi:hypothetical protein